MQVVFLLEGISSPSPYKNTRTSSTTVIKTNNDRAVKIVGVYRLLPHNPLLTAV